jgi:hypothetical protein
MRIFRFLIPLLFASIMLLPASGRAAVDVSLSITVAPPPLPVYVQPAIPDEGYIWAPGYWAWGTYGYYWVPGTWILPPRVGLLWTPGYWAWRDGVYLWHVGYWGPHIGYYGGVNYGFGYIGIGYFGGFWDHDRFHYNTAVNNFGGTHITNVYRQTTVNNITIINNTNVSRVSFNGGRGGTTARPNAAEQAVEREQHVPPTDLQTRHEQTASANRGLLSSVNHGKPPIAATPHPAAFSEHGTVGARGANGAPGMASPNAAHQTAVTPETAHKDHRSNGQPGTAQSQGGPHAAAAANAPHPLHHPPAQPGGAQPQGGPHVAAAANAPHPPHHPPTQPGSGQPQGGQPHPATHQVNAAPHPGPAPQSKEPHGKPQEQPGEHQDNGPQPGNSGPDHH